MKVILLADVKKVGKKGQIVEVSDGYGGNFLIPNKLAVKVTKTSLDIKQKQDDEYAANQEALRQEALKLKDEMRNYVVEIETKVGNNGKMFGAISTKQVVEEFKKQFGVDLDKRKILENKPISNLGYTNLEIELFKNVIGIIIVHVIESK